MTQNPREETYQIEGSVFTKRYANGGVTFLRDGEELTIEQWNRALNEVQPMKLLEEHPNPLVRLKESHRRSAFISFIGPVDGRIVADIGCEEGHLAAMLAGRCSELYCIDIDSVMLENARRSLVRFGNIKYLQSDIMKIDLPDDSIDVCVAAEVLEHLPDPAEGIAELVRITRPGGRICISVPNEILLQNVKKTARSLGLGKSLGRLSGGLAVGHVQVFSKDRLRQLCKDHIKLSRIAFSAPFYLNIFASGTPLK